MIAAAWHCFLAFLLLSYNIDPHPSKFLCLLPIVSLYLVHCIFLFSLFFDALPGHAMEPPCEEHSTKRRRCRLEDDQCLSQSIENLPRDVILDILSRLPVTSLVQFRYVSRAWRMLAQDPDLASIHLSGAARNELCLIFHSDYPIQNQLSFADDFGCHTKVRKFDIPFLREMPEFYIVGSCNGLLCLSNSLYTDTLYLYNPFTKDYRELPKAVQFSQQEVVFGFGFHPVTKEYKVIRIVYYRSGPFGFVLARRNGFRKSQVQVLTLGKSLWRAAGKAPYQFDRWSSEALVEGRLHWVTRRRRLHGSATRLIISFDLADEQFREVPKPDCGGLRRCNFHLLVLAGCLAAAVCCSNGKLEIWVMRDYGVKESWIKEFVVGAYLPKGLNGGALRPSRIWGSALSGRSVRVLCILKNSKILLEYKNRALVYYDPECKSFEDLELQGLPKWFQTIVHTGCLNWVDSFSS